jgi:hypothetical protein
VEEMQHFVGRIRESYGTALAMFKGNIQGRADLLKGHGFSGKCMDKEQENAEAISAGRDVR